MAADEGIGRRGMGLAVKTTTRGTTISKRARTRDKHSPAGTPRGQQMPPAQSGRWRPATLQGHRSEFKNYLVVMES